MLAWPARLSAVVSLRCSPTSVCRSSFPPTVLSPRRPLPSTGSTGHYSPASAVLSDAPISRRPSRRTSFSFAWRYRPDAARSLRRDDSASPCGLGLPLCRLPGLRLLSRTETTRPPGFPGNPLRAHALLSDPGESAHTNVARTCDVAFRQMQGVGTRSLSISRLNLTAYALPVNASRLRSPADSRITRFRLVTDLGRAGFRSCRVPNKVSR